MTHGKGIAATRARIEAAFSTLHNDHRDREQRQADEELRASLTASAEVDESQTPSVSEKANLDTVEKVERRERIAAIYVKAAMKSAHIKNQRTLKRGIHACWIVEAPEQDAATLIAEAMKRLGETNE